MKSLKLSRQQMQSLEDVTRDLTLLGKTRVLKTIYAAWSADETARAKAESARDRMAENLAARREKYSRTHYEPITTINWPVVDAAQVLATLSELVLQGVLKENEAEAVEIYNGLRDGHGYTMRAVGARMSRPVGGSQVSRSLSCTYYSLALDAIDARVPGAGQVLGVLKRVNNYHENLALVENAIAATADLNMQRAAAEMTRQRDWTVPSERQL